MHESLIQYIKDHSLTQLTPKDLEVIKSAFIPKKFKKKQYFLQEGDVCKHVGFIVKGSMRQYSVNTRGAEDIIHLYIENYWTTERESSIMLTPSKYNIDACEDSELLVITNAEMLNLIARIPALNEMIRSMDERNAIANQRRLNSSINNTAEERYEEFSVNHPQFIQRFPQHIIASYLGITKETLSRIRKPKENK